MDKHSSGSFCTREHSSKTFLEVGETFLAAERRSVTMELVLLPDPLRDIWPQVGCILPSHQLFCRHASSLLQHHCRKCLLFYMFTNNLFRSYPAVS